MRNDRRTDRLVPLERSLGNVISDVVRSLASGPDEYDLWYHDAPMWLIHRRRPENGFIRLSRVQIAPWILDGDEVLIAQPDAQLLTENDAGQNPLKALKLDVSSKHAKTVQLSKLRQWHASGEIENLQRYLTSIIQQAWTDAQSFADADFEFARKAARSA